jgi:glycosyltransferase involved in cell wall biosynthesis
MGHEMQAASTSMSGKNKAVAFLFPAFPVLHQTFVLWEVLALRRLGIDVRLYSIKRPSTKTQQPEAAALMKEVHYLPRVLSRPVLAANLKALLRSPARYLSAPVRLALHWWQDRHLASLWRTTPAWRDASLRMLSLRERADLVFNTSPLLYLLKSLWLIPPAVYVGDRLRAEGIDHLHAHWASYPATLALVVRWVFDIPFSFAAHAYDIYLVPRLLPVKARSAEFVVTCAHVNARYLSTLGGPGADDRVFVNYHGVDLERFAPQPKPNDPALPLIVTCGRLQLYKGHHILLRACALLAKPVRCVVIGEGPQRPNLEQLAASLGIADRVQFTGPLPQSEVASWYARADLFALASVVVESSGRRDVIPNVLAEAMAMRIPVVATNVSGIAELVEDGVNGRLVPPNDPRALAAVIDELLADPVQRRKLALGGYEKVRAHFDREKNIRELAKLFVERQDEDEVASLSGAAQVCAGGHRLGTM